MKTVLKLLLIAFLSFFIILISFSDPIYQKPSPAAEQGKLDLSAWNFSQDGTIPLKGEWERYDNQLLLPEDFNPMGSRQLPQPSGYAKLTSGGLSDFFHPQVSTKGIHTYRLVVQTNSTGQSLGILVDNIKMSNKMYIDGNLIGSSGNPAPQGKGYKQMTAAYSAYFENSGKQIEVILQTANYDSPYPGYLYDIVLGSQKDIEFQRAITSAIELCGLLIFFLFGMYYFILFYSTNMGKDFLCLALEFFSIAVMFLFSGQKLIYNIIPNIPFELLSKIIVYDLYLLFFSIVIHVHLREKKFVTDFQVGLFWRIALVHCAVVLLTPYSFYAHLDIFFYFFICFVFFYILAKLRSAYRRLAPKSPQRVHIQIYFIFLGSLLVTLLNNFLYYTNLVSNKMIGSVAACVFVLVSLLFLAFGFMKNYSDLLKVDKVKDEFLLKTSYELKSPLNSIVNLSKSAILNNSDGNCSPSENIENAALTRNIAQRMLTVVDSVLDLTLLRNDQIKLNLSPVDLEICTKLVIESIKKYTDSKNIRIKTDFTKPLIVEADEMRVRQILTALVMNSVKSMAQGDIRIYGGLSGGQISLVVADSGCGISKEYWEEIFQPYVTLNFEGIGLGLYLARQFAEQMGGMVQLLWSEPNKGSGFEILLPASDKKNIRVKLDARRERSFLPYANPASFLEKDPKKLQDTVLVVDDELYQIQTASDILNRANYHVLTSFSGIEALKIMENNQVDLVILDVMMPENSGMDVCRKIREKKSLIELPVLLATVGTIDYDLGFGLQSGANDFITKPFKEKEILARVRTLIAMKHSMEDAVKSKLAFLQAQIKPHFLYNTINTIISFCYTEPEKAAELLTDFSKYLRLTFDIDQKLMLIPLSRELEMVRAYTDIQKARFGSKIRVEYDVDPAVMGKEIPPLSIQPLVENAIRHGLRKKTDGGTVYVSAKSTGSEITITVRDTGVGMGAEKLELIQSGKDTNSGIGILNVKKRIEKWENSSFEISSTEGEGTSITIVTHGILSGGEMNEGNHY